MNMATLSPTLTQLGYAKPHQQRAFMQLLQATGCLGELPEVQGVINAEQADALLANIRFPSDKIAADWLHQATQAKWINRTQGQERWETQTPETLKAKEPELRTALEELGQFSAKVPAVKYYDHALVLGATEPAVDNRLKALKQLWDGGVRFGHIYLLGSERPLLPEREASAAELMQTQPGAATEMTMMIKRTREQAEHWPDALRAVPVTAIDTLRKDGKRANTRDTAESWLAHNPAPGSVLAISTQPYASYQDAALRTVLDGRYKLETVGQATPPQEISAGLALDALARQIDSSRSRKQEVAQVPDEARAHLAEGISLVPASAIGFDPERFQFRRFSDSKGLRKGHEFQGEFDPRLHGGVVVLYKEKSGKLFAVDGHHRIEFAQRSEAAGHAPIAFPARILEEEKGITPLDAKVIGGYINLAEKFRRPEFNPKEETLAEAAGVFHDVKNGAVKTELLPTLPAHPALAQAQAAATLADTAFAYVQDGSVPVIAAAELARQTQDAQEQTHVMRVLKEKMNRPALVQAAGINWAERAQLGQQGLER